MFYLKWVNPGISLDYKFLFRKNFILKKKFLLYLKKISSLLLDVEVTVKRKKPGSPAITLQIKKPPAEISVDIILTLKLQQSWPPSTDDGLKVEQWLGRKVRRELRYESVYLVAKQNKKEKVLRGTWNTENKSKLWIIFFTTWSRTRAIKRVSRFCSVFCLQCTDLYLILHTSTSKTIEIPL